jgi:Fe-S cluster biogenesis protein NfuA
MAKRILANKERNMINKETLESILDKIRPAIQADGGDVELVNIREDNVVEVRLKGACNGCPMATLTLKAGIERIIKEELPEVKEVVSVG